jgi:hypothetical protein
VKVKNKKRTEQTKKLICNTFLESMAASIMVLTINSLYVIFTNEYATQKNLPGVGNSGIFPCRELWPVSSGCQPIG